MKRISAIIFILLLAFCAFSQTVSIDSNTTLQMIKGGLEATSQAGEDTNATTDAYPEYPSTTYPNYKSALLTAMADLNITQMRVEIRLDDVNATGYDGN